MANITNWGDCTCGLVNRANKVELIIKSSSKGRSKEQCRGIRAWHSILCIHMPFIYSISFIISFYNLSVVYSSLKDKLFSVPLECFCELKLSLVARFYGVTSSQVVITVTQCGDLGETRHRDLEHAKVSLHRSTTDSRISYSATGENWRYLKFHFRVTKWKYLFH